MTNDAVGQARVVSGSGPGQLDIRGGRSEEVQYSVDGVRIDPSTGFQTSATTGDFGELFAYRLRDVTLPRRASAMLPIVSEGVDAERLSIYSGGAGRHPMRGVRLKNTTGANLRGGPVTVLDDGYAGDALLPDLPDGAQRLLSFAVDQDVLVDPFPIPDAPGLVETASLRDGVLVVRRQRIVQGGYRLENRGARAKTVLVERARQPGARLEQPAAADETTPALYRLRVELPPGRVDTLRVREAQTLSEQIALADYPPDAILALARADGALPDDVRRALEHAATERRALAETQQRQQQLDAELSDIEREQARIRGNPPGRRRAERLRAPSAADARRAGDAPRGHPPRAGHAPRPRRRAARRPPRDGPLTRRADGAIGTAAFHFPVREAAAHQKPRRVCVVYFP